MYILVISNSEINVQLFPYWNSDTDQRTGMQKDDNGESSDLNMLYRRHNPPLAIVKQRWTK